MSKIHVNQIDETSLNSRVNTLITNSTSGFQSSITGIESDIIDLGNDIDSISGDVVILQSDFSNQSGRLDNFEADFYNFDADLISISGNVNTISGNLNNLSGQLNNEVDDLTYVVNLFTGDVADLETSVTSINSSLGTISGQFTTLSGDVALIDIAKLEVSSNLSDLGNKNSGLANLNLRHQYMFLRPRDFTSGSTVATPIFAGYNPVGGNTGLFFERLSFETIQFTGNAVKEMYCLFSLPSNWDQKRIYPKIYSMVTTAAGAPTSGDTLWNLYAEYFDNGVYLSGGGAPAFSIRATYTGSPSISGVLSIAPTLCSGMQITGHNSGSADFDKLIILKLQRSPADALDTLDGNSNVNFIGLGLEYTVTGSSTRWAQDLI